MNQEQRRPRLVRILDRVEVLGNRLPDPAVLFLLLLIAVWVFSALLAQFSYSHIDPRTGSPLEIHNLATPGQFTHFLSTMVPTFVGFHPLGRRAARHARHRCRRLHRVYPHGPEGADERDVQGHRHADAAAHRHHQPQRRGCRLRAGDSPRRGDLPGCRAASRWPG